MAGSVVYGVPDGRKERREEIVPRAPLLNGVSVCVCVCVVPFAYGVRRVFSTFRRGFFGFGVGFFVCCLLQEREERTRPRLVAVAFLWCAIAR